MVNSYGQKPMEKPWIITHGDFMEFFCKGISHDSDMMTHGLQNTHFTRNQTPAIHFPLLPSRESLAPFGCVPFSCIYSHRDGQAEWTRVAGNIPT